MGIKTFRPITPGLRHRVQVVNEEITTNDSKPEKSLTWGKKSNGGRASNGRISVRHQGGGHKQLYREIDFKRDKIGIPGIVAGIEYDPNRSSNIALVNYVDGEKRYIISPKGLVVGKKVLAGADAPIEPGNSLPLEAIPVGITIHNVELTLGKGGQLARSAGASALVVGKEGDYVTIKLPSGELRMIFKKCSATIGSVGNEDHMARIAGVDLPNKHIEIALTYIYGLGRPSAKKICEQTKVDPNKKVSDLTNEEVNELRKVIESDFKVEGRLRSETALNIKRLMDIGCYRGLRHRRGLPVRGQRTRTNARTRKGKRKTVANKKKAV